MRILINDDFRRTRFPLLDRMAIPMVHLFAIKSLRGISKLSRLPSCGDSSCEGEAFFASD